MTGPSQHTVQLAALYQGTSCSHTPGQQVQLAFYELPNWINITELFSKALSRIFKRRRADVDPDLLEITYAALDEAIDRGFGKPAYGTPNYDFAEQLRESAALFSARKSWAQAKELAALAVKPNGMVRSWKEFQEAAASVVENYNQSWLKTEYNTAIRAARSASEWRQYEANADLYPNLKYLPSRAATPREQHKPYYNLIKPINDDFWVKHMPPSAWNCLCGVEQTDSPADLATPAIIPPAPGLDHNPGLTARLFADSHPYTANLTDEERAYVDKKAKDYVAKRPKNSR